jgi:hypothetical protein
MKQVMKHLLFGATNTGGFSQVSFTVSMTWTSAKHKASSEVVYISTCKTSQPRLFIKIQLFCIKRENQNHN